MAIASPKLVAGGTSAAEIVVVESGQVVLDEGIGVEHFQRRTSLQRLRGGLRRSFVHTSMQRIGDANACPREDTVRMA